MNQVQLNGFCRDIPDVGLTKCGVVDVKYNDYMIFTDDDPSDQQNVDSGDVSRQRRRRSLRGDASLTRIIGGSDTTENRWPWQISITKNSGPIPDPMIRTGSNGCGIFFSLCNFIQIFLLATCIRIIPFF